MIRQLQIALAFLTRLPAGNPDSTAIDVGRSARWFPLVGALLGALYAAMAWLLRPYLPALVIAVFILSIDALLTGAMHWDGLADTADGFGAGRSPQDVLRIMRDHAIGSYGACAVVLGMAMKIAAIAALIPGPRAVAALVLAPVLGRWSAVLSSTIAGYARPKSDGTDTAGSPARFIGSTELIIASLIAAPFVIPMWRWRGIAAALLATFAAWLWTRICRARIGGMTGDTLGAGIELIECLVLLVFVAGA